MLGNMGKEEPHVSLKEEEEEEEENPLGRSGRSIDVQEDSHSLLKRVCSREDEKLVQDAIEEA